jgi:hypothetical protein
MHRLFEPPHSEPPATRNEPARTGPLYSLYSRCLGRRRRVITGMSITIPVASRERLVGSGAATTPSKRVTRPLPPEAY